MREIIKGRARKVLNDALKLPAKGRAAVASSLIVSLEESGDRPPDGPSSSEIKRRIRELDSGAVKAVPWSKVRRMLRKRIAR